MLSRKWLPIIGSGVAVIAVGSIVVALSLPSGSKGSKPEPTVSTAAVQDQQDPGLQEESQGAIVAGGIETSDGRDLSIWLAGGHSNNFAKMYWKKGEQMTAEVEAETEADLEIGLIAVDTDQIYSERLADGKGKIVLEAPEEGDYRLYIRNHSTGEVHFHLVLERALTVPLV